MDPMIVHLESTQDRIALPMLGDFKVVSFKRNGIWN